MTDDKPKRHRLNKTDKRLLAAMTDTGLDENHVKDLIQRHVYTLSAADMKHVASEMENGATETQAMSAVYQARRIRFARKHLPSDIPRNVSVPDARKPAHATAIPLPAQMAATPEPQSLPSNKGDNMEPKAPKTNAQRQAEYRRRCRTRKEGYSAVLHTQLDYGAKYELERLAHYHGMTQRQLLEQLIHNQYNLAAKDLNDEQFDLFQDKKLIITK